MSPLATVVEIAALGALAVLTVAAAVLLFEGVWVRLLNRPLDEGEWAAVTDLSAWRRGDIQAAPIFPPTKTPPATCQRPGGLTTEVRSLDGNSQHA